MPRSFIDERAFLSNFYPSPIEWQGFAVPTVEHAYQAAKTFDPELRLAVASAPTPFKAKRLGRKLPIRPDWEQMKVEIMLELLRLEFGDPQLAELLLATETEELVEVNHWHDTFWGQCIGCHENCDGVGDNMLGRLLMRVREELGGARTGSPPTS
jgi:ribA/ribD-fused uncharacterized protein